MIKDLNPNDCPINDFPFKHVIIDDFVNSELAGKIVSEFPSVDSKDWINYLHYNERKFGNSNLDKFPGHIKQLVSYLISDEFVGKLSNYTGIMGLKADPDLIGGGMHQTPDEGFLNIHADFTVHPNKRSWRRRLNLLIYFNPDWQKEWGGELELWETNMNSCIQKIEPVQNRCVIFFTDKDSFHGHPGAFNSSGKSSRKSLALYYYTNEKKPFIQSTEYRPQPSDSRLKKILISIDKRVLRLYDFLRRKLGFSDKFVSKVLKIFKR